MFESKTYNYSGKDGAIANVMNVTSRLIVQETLKRADFLHKQTREKRFKLPEEENNNSSAVSKTGEIRKEVGFS